LKVEEKRRLHFKTGVLVQIPGQRSGTSVPQRKEQGRKLLKNVSKNKKVEV